VASASIVNNSAFSTSCSGARLLRDWLPEEALHYADFSALTKKHMLKTGILNPHINALLSRVRHTNMLVNADRGFPFWPGIETVDISLMDGIPTVLQVLQAIRSNFQIGQAWMAREFLRENSSKTRAAFCEALQGVPLRYEPHLKFKLRVPKAIGLIRTGDTFQYANMILESA